MLVIKLVEGASARRRRIHHPVEHTSGKSYNMTFIQGVAGDGFYVTMGCGIRPKPRSR